MASRRPDSGRRRRWGALCTALMGLSAVLVAANDIDIVPLVRDGRVLVTFEFEDGVNDEVTAVIQSGLETTFTYIVDLRLDVPVWVDRTIDTVTISNTVRYDTLTRQHHIIRSVDGRVESTEVTEDDAVVREWLTRFHRVPLFSAARLEANREYYVRVRATTRPQNAFFPLPWREGVSGQRKFTFIPQRR